MAYRTGRSTVEFVTTPISRPVSPAAGTPVATVLTPLERVRVDTAARGSYDTLHRESIDQVMDDLRHQRAGAVLVSVARYTPHATARLAEMVREFPRVPAFALLTEVQPSTPHSALSLGQLGVRALIDARQPSGWLTLRELLTTQQAGDVQRLALAALNLDLAGAPADCWRMFELMFSHRPHIGNVRQLGRQLNVLPATLMSRFFRARLPSPKRYIALTRLIRAARLFENPGMSIATVATRLDYSSPQTFGRHMRTVMGMSPITFRQEYDGETMLRYFRERLILPYLGTLREFHPVAAGPAWMPRESSRCTTSSPVASAMTG